MLKDEVYRLFKRIFITNKSEGEVHFSRRRLNSKCSPLPEYTRVDIILMKAATGSLTKVWEVMGSYISCGPIRSLGLNLMRLMMPWQSPTYALIPCECHTAPEGACHSSDRVKMSQDVLHPRLKDRTPAHPLQSRSSQMPQFAYL